MLGAFMWFGQLFQRGAPKLIVYIAPVVSSQIFAPWDIIPQEEANLVFIESFKSARGTLWYRILREEGDRAGNLCNAFLS